MKTVKFYQLNRKSFNWNDWNMIVKNNGMCAFVYAEKSGHFTVKIGCESDGSPIVFLTSSMTVAGLKNFIGRLSDCWLKSDYEELDFCRVHPNKALFENQLKYSETKAYQAWRDFIGGAK